MLTNNREEMERYYKNTSHPEYDFAGDMGAQELQRQDTRHIVDKQNMAKQEWPRKAREIYIATWAWHAANPKAN